MLCTKKASKCYIDIAPTIMHILDIPAPKNSEGAMMYDIFE